MEASPQVQEIINSALPTISANIVVTDCEGLTLYVSSSFTQKTGYTTEDMYGKTPGEILQGPDTEQGAIQILSESIRNRAPVSTKITNYTKCGQPIVFILDVQPCYKGDKLIGFLGIQHDNTELDLQLRDNKIITADFEKNNLMSLLQHDVRDSLCSIITLNQLGLFNDQAVMEAINSCFLAVSRYVMPSSRCCNVYNMTEEVMASIKYRADMYNIVIENKVDINFRPLINSSYLHTVLRNFVVNAVKCSKPDGLVCVYNEKESIYVKDNGIGMSQEKIDYLLHAKLRTVNTDVPGTSLKSGFILCRQLLETQGYYVSICSKIDEGTIVGIHKVPETNNESPIS